MESNKYWYITLVDENGKYITGAIDMHPVDYVIQQWYVHKVIKRLVYSIEITKEQFDLC